MLSKRKKKKPEIDKTKLPQHIAIIMDGNGRWAGRIGLPRSAGHAAGSENFRKIANYCKDIGIKYLTVYAFSTENWKRPADEVNGIMDLLRRYLRETIKNAERDRARFKFIGKTSVVDPDLRDLIAEMERISSVYTEIQVNICLNYGGRLEIVEAARALAKKCLDGAISPDSIDEADFEAELEFAGIPDPDLVIRPSGEFRLSNFMLWQSAYSELYFTDVLWPDFNARQMDNAIIAYQQRSRRFGGVT